MPKKVANKTLPAFEPFPLSRAGRSDKFVYLKDFRLDPSSSLSKLIDKTYKVVLWVPIGEHRKCYEVSFDVITRTEKIAKKAIEATYNKMINLTEDVFKERYVDGKFSSKLAKFFKCKGKRLSSFSVIFSGNNAKLECDPEWGINSGYMPINKAIGDKIDSKVKVEGSKGVDREYTDKLEKLEKSFEDLKKKIKKIQGKVSKDGHKETLNNRLFEITVNSRKLKSFFEKKQDNDFQGFINEIKAKESQLEVCSNAEDRKKLEGEIINSEKQIKENIAEMEKLINDANGDLSKITKELAKNS